MSNCASIKKMYGAKEASENLKTALKKIDAGLVGH
jgi:hypothetical protein